MIKIFFRGFAKFIFTIFLIASSVSASIWGLNYKGFFGLRQVDLVLSNSDSQNPQFNLEGHSSGAAQVDSQAKFFKPVLEALDQDLMRLKGQSLWDLDLEQIGEQISQQKWIAESQVRRSWPDHLEVRIKPKDVTFLYVGKKGELLPVLADGTFLPEVRSVNMPDVVLLRGESFAQKKDLLQKALQVIQQIPARGSFSRATISELNYDDREGFSAQLMRSGLRVKLGEEQMDIRAERVSQVVDYLEANQLDARVIDANLTKKVLVRLRKGP